MRLPSAGAFSRFVQGHIERGMHALGEKVASRPRWAMALPVLFTLCFVPGAFLLETDTRFAQMWYSRASQSWKDLDGLLWKFYGETNRTNIMVVVATSSGAYSGNILQKEALQDVLALQDQVTSSSSRYSDVCVQQYDGGPCLTSSLLDLWDSDSSVLGGTNDADILTTVSADGYISDRAGGLSYSAGQLIGAKALQIVLITKHDDEGPYVKPEKGSDIYELRDFLDYPASDPPAGCADYSTADLNVWCSAHRSFEWETQRALREDQIFITLAMNIMLMYAILMLGKCHPVHSKILISLSILVTIGLSLGFAFGMSHYLGYPMTQMSLMTIFVLIGVGVDDMFILVDAWERQRDVAISKAGSASGASEEAQLQHRRHTEKLHLSLTLAEAGSSITLTSVTDFSAFLVGGAFIDIPAIRYFSIVAALSVLAVFATQLTFFVGALVLDERRVRANRYDCFPCYVRQESDRGGGSLSPTSPSAPPPKRKSSGGSKFGTSDDDTIIANPRINGFRQRLISTINKLALYILRPQGHIACVTVLLFLAMDATMGYIGFTEIKSGANFADFLPSDSYLVPYNKQRDNYFGDQMNIEFLTKTVDVASNEDALGLQEMVSGINDLDFVLLLESWWVDFEAWIAKQRGDATAATGALLRHYPTDGDMTKRALLKQWSEDTGTFGGFRFAGRPDIVVMPGTNMLLSSTRMRAVTVLESTLPKQIRDMNQARKAVSGLTGIGDASALNSLYGRLDREARMPTYTLQCLVGALCASLVVSLAFMHPTCAMVVTLSVSLVCLCMIGTMALWNIPLYIASLANLVMAVGFAVDYSAHTVEACGKNIAAAKAVQRETQTMGTAHRTSLAREELSECCVRALTSLGGSVINGGLSTFLGVLALAFAKSGGFVTLFKMFLAMVIFGLAHGLIFAPCKLRPILLVHVQREFLETQQMLVLVPAAGLIFLIEVRYGCSQQTPLSKVTVETSQKETQDDDGDDGDDGGGRVAAVVELRQGEAL